MCRWTPSLLTLLFVPLAMGTVRAAEGMTPPPAPLPDGTVRISSQIVQAQAVAVPAPAVATLPGHGEVPVGAVPVPAYMPPVQPQYPYLNAPLYPYPQPNVPIQVGSSLITNQAFYPQEMLYPHDYEAMYPPYYYKARGWWVATPFGTRSDERWELLGTKVKVKYRSAIPFWTGFSAPHNKYFDSDDDWDNPAGTMHRGPYRH